MTLLTFHGTNELNVLLSEFPLLRCQPVSSKFHTLSASKPYPSSSLVMFAKCCVNTSPVHDLNHLVPCSNGLSMTKDGQTDGIKSQ